MVRVENERPRGDANEDAGRLTRAAFDATVVPTAVIALGGRDQARVLLASQSFGRLLGRREEELIGQRLTDLVQFRPEAGDPLEALGEGRDASAICEVTKQLDGTSLILELKAACLPGEAGRAVVQLYDATDREAVERSLREELRRLQDIADYSSVLIYVKDADGRYLLINKQYERRYGLTREQVLGRTDFEIYPREIALAYVEHDARVLTTNQAIEVEEPGIDLDKGGNWLSIKFPLRDESGEPYAVGGISTDISDRKRAEAAAKEARAAIERANAALALQESLLPHAMPEQDAIEVAGRYLPNSSDAGVGGDWFDAIRLSGARVALVVGDVVGHGIHASAAMGRLRMAVRTLAEVDLGPDELLAFLDDLVIRLSGGADSEVEATTSGLAATCLYAIYDPVTGRFSIASAGHPAPALVNPDGTAEILDIPTGPPLGVGGLPFECLERDLREGSLLALYTDGLVETRDREIDAGLELLCTALGEAVPSLEATCDRVLGSLIEERPTDDVALLLVRTRMLEADQVASTQIPAEPVAVAGARSWATRQLQAWDLDDLAIITELVVSELVTNAIRYGAPPIQLRLIKNQSLICEVSDASSTAPYLRRARIFDEGGRGLMIVAQLTGRWGTRYSGVGKTIWVEQSIPEGSRANHSVTTC
jgi:PAS domain S-box-containing protein